MKKFNSIFTTTAVYLMAATMGYSQTYTTTQITDNDHHWKSGVQINASGQVVWTEYIGDNIYGIFLYDGSTITNISNNGDLLSNPQISDNGDVVWSGYNGTDNDYEIFLYNDLTITQLTDNSYDDYHPQINDNGDVVWRASENSGSLDKLFLYNGSTATQIADNCPKFKDYGYDPQISDNGHVVWSGYSGTDNDLEIFLFNGLTTTQLTDNNYEDKSPQINDNGHVVWIESGDSYPNKGLLGISLYDGITTTRIKDYTYCDTEEYHIYPQINISGHVVWDEYPSMSGDILLFDGPTITQIINRGYTDISPQINANGLVMWVGNGQISLYDGSVITLIPGGNELNIEINGYGMPQMNDNGHVVWSGSDSSNSNVQIFLSKPKVSDVSIADILVFFDDSTANGTLQGDGPGASAENRLNALRNMLLEAEKFIEAGDSDAACGQLNAAYQLTDGNPSPADLVSGSAAAELAEQIQVLMNSIGCS